jgi:hypothetical protein
MKFSRDSLLGIAILLLLILVISATVIQESGSTESDPYLSTSAAPNGTLAFKLWLKDLGYSTFDEPLSTFAPPDVDAIFIIQPFWDISKTEWLTLDKFVENGGTLVLAGDNYAASASMRHYEFSQTLLDPQAADLSQATPLLSAPVIPSNIQIPTDIALFTQRTDFVPILMAESELALVSFKQGRGTVILSSAPNLFTNVNLKNDTVSAFMLNLIKFTPKGSVWFDEWHHGIQAQSVVGPDQWLQRTPGGRALLFVVFVVFMGLLLQGKAFGRAVPMLNEIKRRGPLEHVTAIANLNRKAGHRVEMMQQYHQRLKRQLGARYRLNPSLPDVDYVNALFVLNPSINKDELLDLLKHLSQKKIGETELIKLAAEAAKWMKD